MIFTDRTIIVQKGTSSINDTIILYRGDKGVEIRFTLNEGSPFKFGSGASPNIIEKTEAAYGQLIIKRPNDLPAVFSEIAPTNEGKIVFTITAEMIDEITEVGNYTFQIRLLDESRNSRATIPEVVNGIEIREPIATEDVSDTNEVGIAAVGYALTTAGTTEDTFDSQGNYNKTTWGTGDRITAAKLNKIEDGIDGVNKKVASGSASGEGMTQEQVSQLSTAYQHSQSTHAPSNAEANVQADWNETNTTSDTYIKNKPTIPTRTSELTNNSDFVDSAFVSQKIAEASVGGSSEAKDITITDVGGYYEATNVEGALQEAGSQIIKKADNIDLAAERARIDNLATLQEGSTTGDAELIDGRIGADGVTYNNIGDSIRKQIKKINANILDFKNGLETFYSYANFDNGTLDHGEFKKYNLKRIASNDIITFDRDIEIHVEAGYKLTICLFQDGAYATDLAYVTDTYRLPKGTSVKVLIGLVDETDAIDNPDILEFLSKVTFKTIVENRIHSVEYENSYNKTLIHNASKDIYTFGHYCNMELGTVDAGVVSYRKNRITSNDILHFDYDIELKIADGYRFGMSVMNSDGSYKEWSGWKTGNYTIKANTYFKPMIAKVTEDDNKVDLIEMNNTVTLSNDISQNDNNDDNNYKDTLELLPGGFGYPGTGGIWTGDLPTNRFITKDIQVAPYDLVVGFNEPSTNYSYQIAFYPSTSTNEATNAEILFKEYCYEKIIIPKGTPYRINYILKDGTVNDIYNHGYKNLIIEKYDKNISAPVYNTLLPSSPKIAMHKGYSGRAPENSAAAFRLAGQQSNVYAIECDIQVTSDGKFVIFHEEDLSSRTNGTGAVGDKTFDEVIACVYDKVANGLDQYPNEHVCSLEEYLKICKKYGKIALCEFKFTDKDRNNIDNFKNFVELLYKTGMQHSTIVISFTSSELAKLHYIDDSIYVLHVLMSYDNFDYRLNGLINNYGVDVNYENSSAGNGLTEQQIEDAHLKGLTVGVWTVDDSSIKDKFINLGVDLITTNRIE